MKRYTSHPLVYGADLQGRLPLPQIPQSKASTAYEVVYFLSARVVYFYALDREFLGWHAISRL
jgi:hypothetical protein